jgi:predicted nucleic acid-binding Zn ribbon protein
VERDGLRLADKDWRQRDWQREQEERNRQVQEEVERRRAQEGAAQQQQVQERQQRELAQLRKEGEEKLSRLLREAYRTGGKPTAEDIAAAKNLVRQYQVDNERAKSILREIQEEWKPEKCPTCAASAQKSDNFCKRCGHIYWEEMRLNFSISLGMLVLGLVFFLLLDGWILRIFLALMGVGGGLAIVGLLFELGEARNKRARWQPNGEAACGERGRLLEPGRQFRMGVSSRFLWYGLLALVLVGIGVAAIVFFARLPPSSWS